MAAFTAAAVKPISRSQRNGGFGADSGPSEAAPVRALSTQSGPSAYGARTALDGGTGEFRACCPIYQLM